MVRYIKFVVYNITIDTCKFFLRKEIIQKLLNDNENY